MKEGIGGIQIFIIVIICILIFAFIMSYTLNQSNAFAIKDQLVSIIENAGGFKLDAECDNNGCNTSDLDEETLQKIIDALDSNSYRQTGSCDDVAENLNEKVSDKAEVAGYTRVGTKTLSGNKDSFCIAKIPSQNQKKCDPYTSEGCNTLKGYYYQIFVFYQLDIPIISSTFNLRAIGETKLLYR